jgi:hypothetical protein
MAMRLNGTIVTAGKGAGKMRPSGRITAVCLGLAVIFTAWTLPASAARKALLVGVEHHSDPTRNLPGVADDVRLVKEVITKKGGFQEKDVRSLLDAQATKQSVLQTFTQWLIDGTAPGDTALFYFSGHGIQVWDENGHEIQDGKGKALICYDSNVVRDMTQRSFGGRASRAFDLKDTVNALLGDEIHKLLSEMKGRTVIFISDSCHSGTVYKAFDQQLVKNKNFVRPAQFRGILEKRFSQPKSFEPEKLYFGSDLTIFGVRLAAFTACENSQVAQVVPFTKDPKGPHSVFTWYLYHGLHGEADLKREHRISFGNLAKFLQDEVKRDGFAQIPQYEFQPEDLSNEPFEAHVARAQERIERPRSIGYALRADSGVSAADLQSARSLISQNIPALKLTEKKDAPSVFVAIEKKGSRYLTQISDSTGAVWESHQGSTVEESLRGLLGNLKALYLQASVSALRNPVSKADFDMTYEIKGNVSRAPGEVVKGDLVVLHAKTKTPGCLYIFSVDTMGVIHPLYPMPQSRPEILSANGSVALGSDGSFSVQEPFGRDMIFAFLLPRPSDSLARFWDKDDVGDIRDPGASEQDRFLSALWSELAAGGKPKGDWRGKVLVLRSFQQ